MSNFKHHSEKGKQRFRIKQTEQRRKNVPRKTFPDDPQRKHRNRTSNNCRGRSNTSVYFIHNDFLSTPRQRCSFASHKSTISPETCPDTNSGDIFANIFLFLLRLCTFLRRFLFEFAEYRSL